MNSEAERQDIWGTEICGRALDKYMELNGSLVEFAALFEGEKNDRAAAIVAATYLDTQLEHVLWNYLADDEKEVRSLLGTERPLGSFGAKITMVYCLGLVGKMIRDDLRLVQKIRNRFAHALSVSFSDEPVRTWCLSLKWHEEAMMCKPPPGATPAQFFQVGVNQIVSHLHGIVSLARQQRKQIPDWP
jgi:hypothetical protein